MKTAAVFVVAIGQIESIRIGVCYKGPEYPRSPVDRSVHKGRKHLESRGICHRQAVKVDPALRREGGLIGWTLKRPYLAVVSPPGMATLKP